MKNLTLKSFAKLNLYLKVINKRKDGFHNIHTLFERISLHDTITLKTRPDNRIKIICKNPDVPKSSANLCFRAAALLKKNFHKNIGLDIEIIKRIPVGAGLGGGSSNAAAVILGLNRLWNLKLPKEKLSLFARKIGCDVPFFIYETYFAFGYGRGDLIKPLNRVKPLRLWHILVVPKIKVSTPLIYRKWDLNTAKKAGLTRVKSSVKIQNCILFNSLQEITAKFYPEVERIRQRLIQFGLKAALMSGSGPAVMAIVSSRKEALSVSRRLRPEVKSWRIFIARTN